MLTTSMTPALIYSEATGQFSFLLFGAAQEWQTDPMCIFVEILAKQQELFYMMNDPQMYFQ